MSAPQDSALNRYMEHMGPICEHHHDECPDDCEGQLAWEAECDLARIRSRLSALEGLLRECRVHVQYAEHTIGCQARYGEKTCACGIFGLLSRLDAALTPDRKDQDGR